MNILKNKKDETLVTMSVFENSMGAIARSFTQMEERTDQQFAAIDKRFDAFEKRFDKYEVVLGTILDEMRGFRYECREDRLAVAALAHNDLEHDGRLSSIERKIA